MLKPIFYCALVVAVAGCDSYGPYPSDYEHLAKSYFEVVLKDLESPRYRVTKPVKCYLREAPVSEAHATGYGHCALVFVNAQNSHGHSGWVQYRVFFGHGALGLFSPNSSFQERWLSENWAGE
jgi:hypothetical protein